MLPSSHAIHNTMATTPTAPATNAIAGLVEYAWFGFGAIVVVVVGCAAPATNLAMSMVYNV